MSEEEIIEQLEDRDMLIDCLYENFNQSTVKPFEKAISGLLDLYNKEKESDTKHLAEIGQLRTQLHAEKEKNKELTEYLITQNYEINRLNLDKIRLEMSQLPDTAEGYKYLKHEYEMRLGRMNLEDYKRNYISKEKIREKIKEIEYLIDSSQGCMDKECLEEYYSEIKFCRELLEEE